MKNYDPQRDKRFSGTVRLPNIPKPQMKVCILADAAHGDIAKSLGIDSMSVENLKKLNKNKKEVKKLAASYDAFLASEGIYIFETLFIHLIIGTLFHQLYTNDPPLSFNQTNSSFVGSWFEQGWKVPYSSFSYRQYARKSR